MKIADSDSSVKENKEEDAGDGKGPLKFKCLNGHTNKRPLGGYVMECKECVKYGKDGKASVGCK